MKHKHGAIVGALLLTHTAVFANNEAIASYVCEEEVLFEESVSQQPIIRLHALQGAYGLITEHEVNDPILTHLHQKLAGAHINAICRKLALEFNNGLAGKEVIARVYFDFDSSKVNKNNKILLSRLNAWISENEGEYVIEGHTDNKGSAAYNWSLGLKRSQAIAQYVTSRDSVTVTTMGETSPIARNNTEQGRQKNRRVDIKQHE